MGLKDVHILILMKLWICYLRGKREFADEIKAKDHEMRLSLIVSVGPILSPEFLKAENLSQLWSEKDLITKNG